MLDACRAISSPWSTAARRPGRSFPEDAPRVVVSQFVRDAFIREADELGERRVRPTGAAGQRWDEASQRREGMAVDRPKIDGLRRMAGRTAHPKEPMPRLESAADRWREQHWHALGLPFIPRCDEAAGVFEDLGLGPAFRGRFLLGGCRALCLHLAAVEAHVADFAAAVRRESSGRVYVTQKRPTFRSHSRGRGTLATLGD